MLNFCLFCHRIFILVCLKLRALRLPFYCVRFFWIVACSLIRVDFNIATLCCACSHVWFGFYNQTTEHFSIKAVYFAHIFASLLFLWFLNQTQNISEIRNIVLVCFFFSSHFRLFQMLISTQINRIDKIKKIVWQIHWYSWLIVLLTILAFNSMKFNNMKQIRFV